MTVVFTMNEKYRIFIFNQRRRFSISLSAHKKVQPSTKTKNVSSHNWLSRQLSDPFIEKAKRFNYRCRSAFKLIEMNDRFKILQPGYTVIDCGASPGSWTQVAVKQVNADQSNRELPQGIVVAVDRQLIYPINGATIFGNSDFTELETQKKILHFLNGQKVDSVISDMAPNASGIKDLDTENIMQLCYAVLKFAVTISNIGASVLVKLWQCGQTKALEIDMKKFYENVRIVKPISSRSDSSEIFMLGRSFKGLKSS